MIKIIDRKIRMAIVGCGRISNSHFESVKKHQDNIELVSLCDINESIASAHASKYNVKGYSELEYMLKTEALDVVVLCTPSGFHAGQTELCAEHGINVITEKRFGKIHMVHINVFWSRSQEYYDQAAWRGTWEFDGGAFMNQASHYVDLLDWLIGPIDKVHSMMSTTRNIEVEDTGVINIKWRNGALGSMSVSMLTYPKNLEGSITILGEKGTVRVGGVAVNHIQHWEFSDTKDYDHEIENVNYQTNSVYGFGHMLYYQNIVDVFRGKKEPETDGREGLKSLEVLIAAYLSARDGKTISLPLDY